MAASLPVTVRRFQPADWLAAPAPDVVAVIDVELDEHGRIAAVTFGAGPDLSDADDEALDALVQAEVAPRLERLVTHQGHDDPWEEASTGHLQLTLVSRELPTL
jgi:hypothetical protein